jgi:sulfide dehydrogenase cytochrome subunit
LLLINSGDSVVCKSFLGWLKIEKWEIRQFNGASDLIKNIIVACEHKEVCSVSKIILSSIFLACAAMIGMTFSGMAFSGEVDKLVEPCFECHGKYGVSAESKVPTIAGYSEDYFGFSLGMYLRSERPCVEVEYPTGSKKGTKTNMCEVVKNLSESDIEQISEYFAKQKFVRTVQTYDAELARQGESIHLNRCEVCHTKAASAASDNIGILAGQKMDYLREQIRFVKEGKRFTSKKMKLKLDSLSDAELEAVVHYYGSFQ